MSTNKHRHYEVIYLVQHKAPDEARAALAERLKGAIETNFGGEIVKAESWGDRRLAYEIKIGAERHTKATYEYLVVKGPANMTHELERILRLNELCIRFLTIKLDSYDASVVVNAPTDIMEA
jgi:small subunit ribosomal protein S6